MFIIRNIFFILFNNVIKVNLHYKFEWGKVFIPKLSEIFRKVNRSIKKRNFKSFVFNDTPCKTIAFIEAI